MSAVLPSPGLAAVRIAINVVAFQLAWFACVGAAAHDQARWGVAAVAAAVGVHFTLSRQRAADARLLGLCIVFGIVFDTLAMRAGWIEYAAPQPIPGFAPAWIVALWALFATALREPLRWLHGRPAIAAAFGAVGGPLSYAAAARLGACRFEDPAVSLVVLGIGWAVLMPLLAEAGRRAAAVEGLR